MTMRKRPATLLTSGMDLVGWTDDLVTERRRPATLMIEWEGRVMSASLILMGENK
jgi:hypothetical protein